MDWAVKLKKKQKTTGNNRTLSEDGSIRKT